MVLGEILSWRALRSFLAVALNKSVCCLAVDAPALIIYIFAIRRHLKADAMIVPLVLPADFISSANAPIVEIVTLLADYAVEGGTVEYFTVQLVADAGTKTHLLPLLAA